MQVVKEKQRWLIEAENICIDYFVFLLSSTRILRTKRAFNSNDLKAFLISKSGQLDGFRTC